LPANLPMKMRLKKRLCRLKSERKVRKRPLNYAIARQCSRRANLRVSRSRNDRNLISCPRALSRASIRKHIIDRIFHLTRHAI
jgi:hypothetical protein